MNNIYTNEIAPWQAAYAWVPKTEKQSPNRGFSLCDVCGNTGMKLPLEPDWFIIDY